MKDLTTAKIEALEKRIGIYERAILNCVAQFQEEGSVRKFGSDEATVNFFLTRYKNPISED